MGLAEWIIDDTCLVQIAFEYLDFGILRSNADVQVSLPK